VSNENAVRNLIRVDDKDNPTLFRALQLLIDDVYKLNAKVFPTKILGKDQASSGGKVLGAVQNFTGTAYPDNLRLDWDDLPGAFRYQIRMGDDWDTAKHVLTTATDVANIDPMYLRLVYGDYNFIIRAVNVDGKLGDPSYAELIIPVIPPPELDLQVVVSTVMLRWTVPVSAWRIDHYIIYKDNVAIGAIYGTFKLLQEQVGGDYAYSVEAVDIVGNISTRSAVKIARLHDPSEFEFVNELSAAYDGVYVRTDNTVIDSIQGIVGPIDIYTWEDHFFQNGFYSPQDQIDAGYPLYFQPSYIGDGTYEEVFDFGLVYNNLTVVADYNKSQLYGSTNITTELSYSEDNITFSTPVIGNSVLATTFRYVKVKWTFTNVDDKSAAFISNLKVVLNVTLTLDSGVHDVLANDCDTVAECGTEIFYNKIFTGISSVTATPATSLQPLYAVADGITKDSFRCLVFDSSGNRVNATISWKARGVV
jgi:hypothetical protein